MNALARAAVAIAAAAFVACAAFPLAAVLGLLRQGGEVPETFDGARTALRPLHAGPYREALERLPDLVLERRK